MTDNLKALPSKKKKFEGCQFCGSETDHRGYWQCPRLKSVSLDPDGTWAVEFWPESEDAAPVDS